MQVPSRHVASLVAALLSLAACGGGSDPSPQPECAIAADCGADTECRTFACNSGSCATTDVAAGTSLATQLPGDCKERQCDGSGGTVTVPLDSDLPADDGGDCTSESCSGGAPLHPALDLDTPCTQNGGAYCDGAGACVECNLAAQCAGSDTECQSRTCIANACGLSFTGAGTAVASQTPGDCQENQCDGVGAIVSVALNGDLPADDGNQCTADTCSSGAPVHPPVAPDTACNQSGGLYCDGAGACVQCNTPAQCPGITDECQAPRCSSNACGTLYAPAGTACVGTGVCDGAGVCLPAPLVVAISPSDGSITRVPAPISVTFSTAMNPPSLTAQTSAGPCSGSIQLSSDDFASCRPFASAAPAMTGGDSVATLLPAPGLEWGVTFKVRITTAVSSAAGVPLAAARQQANGFTTQRAACATGLVISQVYGGGGNAGAPFRNDFIELFNAGTVAANLDGLSIQYASATGTLWSVMNLPVATVQPGGYFLVQLASGGANGALLPSPDLTSTVNISASAGKVALVASTNALAGPCPAVGSLVDFVGYGATAACFSGAGPAPAGSTVTAVLRAGESCADDNWDAYDFTPSAPVPRSSAAPASVCACTVNETGQALEMDWCSLQGPPSTSTAVGVATESLFGRVFEDTFTQPGGPNAFLTAQLGYGPPTANPEYEPGWTWIPATFNVQIGNDDEYGASITAPAPGEYRYTYRFSRDGRSWTYCDADGAGANLGLTFSVGKLGVLTVTP